MRRPERTLLWADTGLYSGFSAGGIKYMDAAVCERFARDFNEWAVRRGCADELEVEWNPKSETLTLYEDIRTPEAARPYAHAPGFMGISIGYDLGLTLVDALEDADGRSERKLDPWVARELRSVERPNIAVLRNEETRALLSSAGIDESAVDFYMDGPPSGPGSGGPGDLPGLQLVLDPEEEDGIGREMTFEP